MNCTRKKKETLKINQKQQNQLNNGGRGLWEIFSAVLSDWSIITLAGLLCANYYMTNNNKTFFFSLGSHNCIFPLAGHSCHLLFIGLGLKAPSSVVISLAARL